MQKKILTICIPTYNKIHLIIPLLCSIKNAIKTYDNHINLIVSENFSNDENKNNLKEYNARNPFFILYQHDINIGAIENIYFLSTKVNTEYVWFLSDDDLLRIDTIEKIFNILYVNRNINLMFINHQTFKDNPNNIIKKVDLLDHKGLIEKSKNIIIDLTKINGEIFMFISSLIYNAEKLKQFISLKLKYTLVDPIKFSFFCGSENLYILNEPLILQRSANASWSKIGPKLFSWEYQASVSEFCNFGYDQNDLKSIVEQSYIDKNGNYLRMLLFSPIKPKLKIVLCLRGSNFYLFFDSLKYNFKKYFGII